MDLLLLLLIPMVPFLGFFINGLWGQYFSKRLSGMIGISTPIISLFLFLFLIFTEASSLSNGLSYQWFSWNAIPPLSISFTLLLDQLSSFMCFIILFIGSLIHIYSTQYMEEESPANFARYFSYLNLFIFFMLLLVLAGNLWVMFIGWEGVGLTSFLLIGYWFQKKEAVYSSVKAFVINRVGDLGFISALFLLLPLFPSLDFFSINAHSDTIPPYLIELVAFSLFIAATAKSAQIPLHIWLADAMTGPTPVSALIHAATMVTAGIYMICRLSPFYEMASLTTTIIGNVGAITAFLGALLASQERNLKRILAYSTVSQLGNMFAALGALAFIPALFHLFTHAFFKAALFLSAGATIHAFHGEQDIEKMGGAFKGSPLNGISFLIASLSLAAFPFTSGFVSKEGILHSLVQQPSLLIMLILTSILTSFYIAKTYLTVFMGERRGEHLHPIGKVMLFPIVFLALISLLLAIPFVHNFVQEFLAVSLPVNYHHHTGPLIPIISIGGMLFSFIVAYWIVIKRQKRAFLMDRLSHKFYFDFLFESVLHRFFTSISRFFAEIILERFFIEGFQKLILISSHWGSKRLRYTSTGYLQMYSLVTIGGMLSFIVWCLYV